MALLIRSYIRLLIDWLLIDWFLIDWLLIDWFLIDWPLIDSWAWSLIGHLVSLTIQRLLIKDQLSPSILVLLHISNRRPYSSRCPTLDLFLLRWTFHHKPRVCSIFSGIVGWFLIDWGLTLLLVDTIGFCTYFYVGTVRKGTFQGKPRLLDYFVLVG